jgi:hypothetical protein
MVDDGYLIAESEIDASAAWLELCVSSLPEAARHRLRSTQVEIVH